MAGYLIYDEDTGEAHQRMYDWPFMVRGKREWMEPETVASFKTREDAEKWIAKNETDYKQGANGYERLWVENWNI